MSRGIARWIMFSGLTLYGTSISFADEVWWAALVMGVGAFLISLAFTENQ